MSGDTTDRKFANTLARGLAILRAFRASDSGLTHAQIADRTGLPKPTVSRLTYTLCELGYLSHGGRNDRFRLGPSAIALGSVASVAVNFLDLVSDAMQQLADETGTLLLVAVRDDEKMMLVRTWRPQNGSTIWLEPGHRIPVFGSSSGMAVGEPVSFTAGAMPHDLPDSRIVQEVGPALRELVRALEQRTGRTPALSRRD